MCKQGRLFTAGPEHPSPAPHQAPFPSMSASPQYHGEGWKRKPGLMRVYSTSEKLRWDRKNQV